MKIRVLGGGWYGCHIARSLMDVADVELHEIRNRLFAGASGNNPARLHLGFHYPRSRLTRAMCQEHQRDFLEDYGWLTRAVPINIYAVAADESLVDFGTYLQVLRGEVDFVPIETPGEFGLQNVEGAVLTGERHILIDDVRLFFEGYLGKNIHYETAMNSVDDDRWDWTIDCTFCANDAANIDRYEPCLMALIKGPTDKAVTIMDGPFPSIYPWNEEQSLCSLTSAKLTPFSKMCKTYKGALEVLGSLTSDETHARADQMMDSMARYFPEVSDIYEYADARLSIRAMPLSGADARLVDVIRVGERALQVRAGKIDAIHHAARMVKEMIQA